MTCFLMAVPILLAGLLAGLFAVIATWGET
jgi:hypothetical protein